MRLFRKNDDLRQLVEHQRRRRALGTVIVRPPREPQPPAVSDDAVAPVISLAAARARRVGHPSTGGAHAPVTARR